MGEPWAAGLSLVGVGDHRQQILQGRNSGIVFAGREDHRLAGKGHQLFLRNAEIPQRAAKAEADEERLEQVRTSLGGNRERDVIKPRVKNAGQHRK
jgi:hypothetical protein